MKQKIVTILIIVVLALCAALVVKPENFRGGNSNLMGNPCQDTWCIEK